ncbi:hypothetical protein F4810DRAFT_693236, partial [Camillea tinctor]
MVGVPRTNACNTCRKRKIKCDEVRPVCGHCRKGRRECLERPKWRFIGQSKDVPETQDVSTMEPRSRVILTGKMPILNTKKTDAGATFHKFRLGRRNQSTSRAPPLLVPGGPAPGVPRAPSGTPLDLLRGRVVNAFDPSRGGLSLLQLSRFLGSVPRYTGQSELLDLSTSYLVQAHECLANPYSQIPFKLHAHVRAGAYLRTIRALRRALDDPEERYRGTTLSAISILTLIDGMGPIHGLSETWDTHCKGITDLLASWGPERVQTDELALTTYRGMMGSIAMNAAIKGTDDFVIQPEWQAIDTSVVDKTVFQHTARRTVHVFSRILRLTKDVRRICDPTANVDVLSLIAELNDIKLSLSDIERDANMVVDSGYGYVEIPSPSSDPEVPYIYDFGSEIAASMTYVFVWCWTIVTNMLLGRVYEHWYSPGFHMSHDLQQHQHLVQGRPYSTFISSSYHPSSPALEFELENQRLLDNIAKSVEWCEPLAPLGAWYMNVPLAIAYRLERGEARRRWIANKMAQLFVHFRDIPMEYIAESTLAMANVLV